MTVVLTQNASDEIKRFAQEKELGNSPSIRFSIRGGGCSGFVYGLSFADAFDENEDTRCESLGVTIISDKRSALLLQGTEIDCHTDGTRSGFTFSNPNETRSCSGCGGH